MFAVPHGAAMRRPCVRCLVTGEDIITGQIAIWRSLKDTFLSSESFLEIVGRNIKSVGDEHEVAE